MLIPCFGASHSVFAMGFDPYLKAEASVLKVSIADVDFYPKLSRGALGVFLWQGVGVEVQSELMSSEYEDEDTSIFANTEGYQSIALRFQSPFENEWAAYVNLGYSRFDLKTYQKAPLIVTIDENLQSGFAEVGFEKQIRFYPRLSYAITYEHLFDDDLVKIKALNVSFRYAFGEQ